MYHQYGYDDKYTTDLTNSIDRLISTKLALDKKDIELDRTLVLSKTDWDELQALSNVFIDDTKPMGFCLQKQETH